MKFCLQGLLGIKQRKAVYMFLNVCRKILAENVNIDKIPDLLIYANEMLAILEKDMPITIL